MRFEKIQNLMKNISPSKSLLEEAKPLNSGLVFDKNRTQSQLSFNFARIAPRRNLSPIKGSVFVQSPGSAKSKSSLFSVKGFDLEKKMNLDEKNLRNIRVGRRLSDQTTKRVSIIALLLIFIIPLFDSNYYFDKDRAFTFGLRLILKESEQSPQNLSQIKVFYQNYISEHQNAEEPLVFVYVPSLNSTFVTDGGGPDSFRPEEKENLVLNSNFFNEDFVAVVSTKTKSQNSSFMNILRTIFISLVLGLGAYLFSKDTTELALKPIARMIEKVNKIASNPLATKDLELERGDALETVAIENAIIKIGTLLALGFGDAGSEIIAKNVSQGGDVDPMLPGLKQYAIFGFCDIRNFTDSTEVLQEDVMLFVNKIAFIVHKTVDKFLGIANKNIGDAFLLLWKFDKNDIETLPHNEFSIKRNPTTKNIADFSLIAFLKIICSINSKDEILQYRKIKALNARLPSYKVKMGFGLHVGWAIEGAIGSEYKIDASYLSPNVNIASRLEAATKQYGVCLLISHELYDIFSKRVQRLCREIDRVTVKGSQKPLALFTMDMDLSGLQMKTIKGHSKEEIKIKHKIRKAEIQEAFFASDEEPKKPFKASSFFEFDSNLMSLTRNTFGNSRNLFAQAFELYIQGSWENSRKILENLRMSDGPSATLLNFMRGYNFEAPIDWMGFRELVDK